MYKVEFLKPLITIQRHLESINLSATNGTFVTKGEIKYNFLTTLTDKPKLNHWVKTLLNQIVNYLSPPKGVFNLFFSIEKKVKLAIFDKKHHLEEKR